MRFTITFTLLFFICCTKGNDKKLELKNYISNVNANLGDVLHSQPLNETIHHESNLKENLLSYTNADDSQKLSKPINGESVNYYLRTFTNANSRHKANLKYSMSQWKKQNQRKIKKKKSIKRTSIYRYDSSDEIRVPLEGTSIKKYLRLFDDGNDEPSLNNHSTSHVNDDINYQQNQNKDELNLKKYVEDDSLNKELKSYENGTDHPLNVKLRSKSNLYEYLMSQIKSNKNNKLKQRKVKKKKNNKKVSRENNIAELQEPLEDIHKKRKLNVSDIGNNKPNDYLASYANDNINYQLNPNESELNLNKNFALYSVNKVSDHLLYQYNSKLSLQKHSMLHPDADDLSLNKDFFLYGNGNNDYPLNLHIRSKPSKQKNKSNNKKKMKQRRAKKKKMYKNTFRVKNSDELLEPLEDTSTERKIYSFNNENNKPSRNVNSTAYVNDDINSQINQNESELNINNYFATYFMNGDGNHQLFQHNSAFSLKKYPYSNEDDRSQNKDLFLYGNGVNYHPLDPHILSKPSLHNYLMSQTELRNDKKRKRKLMKKRKSSKKISRVESGEELHEPLEDTSKKNYLRLSGFVNNKPSSNNDSTSGNDDINYQLNQNKSELSLKNYTIPYPNEDNYKTDQNNGTLSPKNDSMSYVNGENYQPLEQYIRSYPSTKKLRFKSYNTKRLKQSRVKSKRTRQKAFRINNRDEQPFKDMTRKKYLRLFKIGNSKPRTKKYMLFLTDQNHQNNYGKLQSSKYYDKPIEDNILPNLKKSILYLKQAANLLEPDSPMQDDYDVQNQRLSLNLFLLNDATNKDIPYYNALSEIPKDYNDNPLTLKYQLLPRNKNKVHQLHKSALNVDNLSYDKSRPIFNMNLVSD